MRCLPGNPGALTRRPTNQLSGAGQYLVIVTPPIHVPCAFLLGGAGTFPWPTWLGARPPIGAPPVGDELRGVARATAAELVTSAPANRAASSGRRRAGRSKLLIDRFSVSALTRL